MKILVRQISNRIGHQIIDVWSAYTQHKNNYKQTIECKIIDSELELQQHDYNLSILLVYFLDYSYLTDQITKQYDLVLICNGGEQIEYCNPESKKLIESQPNTFLITSSYLTQDYVCHEKTIWFPVDIQNCRDYWSRYFYPQYFDFYELQKLSRNQPLHYINGANRAHRQFFLDLLSEADVDIPMKNSFSSGVCELSDSQWESKEDTDFKIWVNQKYEVILAENYQNNYYDLSVPVGIDQKFGSVPPGYFHLPLYFENYCVVFPETSWQNNVLTLTEKSLKCFYAGSLPLPVGGAKINQLYNKLGFYTAWNLLPSYLQEYDDDLDHQSRYKKIAQAIKWLYSNSEVFFDKEFISMTNSNKINFLTCQCSQLAIEKFDKVLTKFVH
jgi:hypothetical protein